MRMIEVALGKLRSVGVCLSYLLMHIAGRFGLAYYAFMQKGCSALNTSGSLPWLLQCK
jgi:hypothetical protein